MIGCLLTRVRKQPIIALDFEFENELKFYNLEASFTCVKLTMALQCFQFSSAKLFKGIDCEYSLIQQIYDLSLMSRNTRCVIENQVISEQ